MTNFLKVNPSTPLGAQVASTNDALVQLFAAADSISSKTAQSIADDATGAALATLLGAPSAADALAINNLLGSLKTDLNNGANSFLQFRSRINRS